MFRKNVTRLQSEVWDARDGLDAYTGTHRRGFGAQKLNVDHVVELQILQHAAGDVLATHDGLIKNFCEVVNAPLNLNVTSSRINQAKRGPFTAAINRLKSDRLRTVSVEQLARSGSAKWMVDEGVWAKIEKETVLSFDALEETLRDQRLTRAHEKTLDSALDKIRTTLEKIQIIQ